MVTFSDSLLRPEIAALPAYQPGARPGKAAHSGHGHGGWGSQLHSQMPAEGPVKLSSNENPYLPMPAVVEAITAAAQEINRYPDMHAADLVAALAAKFGVTESQIVTGNGSVAVFAHLLGAVINPGDEVIYPWRSFEAYPICIAVAGGIGVPVQITDDGEHDFPGMLKAITPKTKVIVVCSPNNPTGNTVTTEQFTNFMKEVPPRVLVILDEAYVEFIRNREAVNGVPLLEKYPNLVCLRTMSKAYGLAGLRVGFAIGQPELIAGVRSVSTPFGVNSLAQAAAAAALKPPAERVVTARVTAIVAERTRVVEGLKRQGWQVPDAQGNFVWLPLGRGAKAFAEAAKAEGLLVRPFDDDGINGGVRVTISEGAANNKFLNFTAHYPKP